MKFKVLTAVGTKTAVFWEVEPKSSILIFVHKFCHLSSFLKYLKLLVYYQNVGRHITNLITPFNLRCDKVSEIVLPR